MLEQLLISLSGVLVLGILAQWLGWRLRFPSILILLVFGILAGPVTGLIRPQVMLGPLLYPVVSLSVAVILFEGGLSLSIAEFRAVGATVTRLVTLGMLVSWLLGTAAAHLLLGFEWELAVLLGAVLVVTGPTVIGPLLRHIRPSGTIGSVLKWEGIVIDPIGALLAVLVFQVIALEAAPLTSVVTNIAKTVVIGSAAGLLGAALMVLLLRRDWVPDFLQSPVTLTMVVAAFVIANTLQHESGLLAVTVMGFALANQKRVSVQHIIEFKENLSILLLAGVFILLAANLNPADLASLSWTSPLFLAALILVVRPASVFIATLGSPLSLKEKLFLAWLAPRGIVAAAVASIFALRLTETGRTGGEALVAVTFLVVIGTVTFYGLTAGRVARRLGLAKPEPDGVLFLGGRFWVRRLAKALKDEGFPVMIVDNSKHNVLAARMEGVPATYASVFSEPVLQEVELAGIGKLLATTANEEVNALAALHFAPLFGRNQLFQLAPDEEKLPKEVASHLRGRIAFGMGESHMKITQRFLDEWVIKKNKLSKDFDFKALQDHYLGQVVPLFLITEGRRLQVFNAQTELSPQPGQTLISLVKPTPEAGRNNGQPAEPTADQTHR